MNGNSGPLIAQDRLTVPILLKQYGYTTACVGKWHLGMTLDPKHYERPIVDGPLQHGFDRFFGISASLDMPPFAFIEDDHFTQVPSVAKKWVRSGPAAVDFEAVDVVPMLVANASTYIQDRAAASRSGTPFFLYVALTSPHTPLVPSKVWQGKSELGPYGDFVMETDWAAGEIVAALEKARVSDNTLVIFTSDNGCAPYIDVAKLESQGHFPSAQFRGYKADIWDGGHRVPFIVRWPNHVKPGSISRQLVCLTDLIATCAEMVERKLPANAGEDSVSLLPALLGKDQTPLREAIVHHSINGMFAIRQANWKLEFCPGSGGWAAPRDPAALKEGLPKIQLYEMGVDIGEKNNVQSANPEIVDRLTQLLQKYVADGRSTPGAAQPNDAAIELFKKPGVKPAKGAPTE